MANNTGKKFGGRVKSTPNKTTQQSKEIVQKVISNELENLEVLLSKLSAKDRVNALIKLLPFVIPKQQEISIDTPIHQLQPIVLTVIEEPLKLVANEKT
jgi:hypothetical protein